MCSAYPVRSGVRPGLAGLLLVALAVSAEGGDSQPAPQDLAFSPDGGLLAVADAGCDAVRLFDAASGVLRGTVRLAGRARGLAWDGGRLLAAEYDAGTVAEIDPVRATVARRHPVGPKPWGVAVEPASHRRHEAELAAALQIGANDGGNVFAGSVVAAETHHRKRKLGQAHAGDFHAKLRPSIANRPDHER